MTFLEEKFRTYFEKSANAIFIVNKNGNILDANSAAENLSGYRRSEILTQNLINFTPLYGKEKSIKDFISVVNNLPDAQEYLFIKKDGRRSYWHIEANMLNDDVYILHAIDITESKRKELILASQLELIAFSNDHSIRELLQKFLDETEKLTYSQIGFFHFVEPDQITLSLQAWSSNTLKNMCQAEGEGLHYPLTKAGVWVDCVRQKKPIVHNDYPNLPHRKGLPEGHAPVMRELVVPVFRNNKIMAILGVGNKDIDYDDRDIETVQQLADLAWEIIFRKQAENEVKRQLAEKEFLLKETHHRIKNNLASVEHLFALQMEALENKEALSSLQDAASKIASIRVLYEKMLLAGNGERISVKKYLKDLVYSILGIFPASNKIKVNLNINDYIMDAKILFAIGIIVNELITNILKYAFVEISDPELIVSLKDEEDYIKLCIEDNGKGLPSDFELSNSKGFGLTLVKMLTEQINGIFEIENKFNNSGTKALIFFNAP